MAAGKSTLARDLADREKAVLLVQDDLLGSLFPGEITNVQQFVKGSSRLKNALASHVCALLCKMTSQACSPLPKACSPTPTFSFVPSTCNAMPKLISVKPTPPSFSSAGVPSSPLGISRSPISSSNNSVIALPKIVRFRRRNTQETPALLGLYQLSGSHSPFSVHHQCRGGD